MKYYTMRLSSEAETDLARIYNRIAGKSGSAITAEAIFNLLAQVLAGPPHRRLDLSSKPRVEAVEEAGSCRNVVAAMMHMRIERCGDQPTSKAAPVIEEDIANPFLTMRSA
mgnify:CR=1 FL=1